MLDSNKISTLPKGFELGGEFCSRPGATCQVARRLDSQEEYIVKTICIPPSQTQVEALILTGAYPDEEAAGEYYRGLAENMEREVRVLDKLCAQRGFFDFSGCQSVPMTDGVGYEVTLIAPRRKSLEELLATQPMTHRGAVNMAIDLCAALAACREAGYLYVNLKPGNVFLSDDGDWRIGDLGFEKLTGLKYAVLPDRCRSPWTPPEIRDAYSALNTTMDIYALGLILFQAYNHGRLPWKNQTGREALMTGLAEGGLMPAPANADYTLTQIIQKACAYDPAQRWQTPVQMAQALIEYLKANRPGDEIIAPLLPEEEPVEEAPIQEEPEENTIIPEESPIPEESEEDTLISEEPPILEESEEDTLIPEESPILEEPGEDPIVPEESPILEEPGEDPIVPEESPMQEDAFIPVEEPTQEPVEDAPFEELPDEAEEDWLARMDALLSQVDDDGTPLPSLRELLGDLPLPDEPAAVAVEDAPPAPQPRKNWIPWVAGLIILALLTAGVWFGYQEYILQNIDRLSTSCVGDTLTVSVSTDMDESRLTVVCVDQYGTRLTSALEDGQALFTGMMPDTRYSISLEAQGLCVLAGQTTAQFTTPQETTIIGFSAATGPVDGSVLLTFDTDGPDSRTWILEYGAAGMEPETVSFSGHVHTVTGLTPGMEYTFTLSAGEGYHLSGQCSLTFTANSPVYAQHLTLSGNADGSITANWTSPADLSVESWTARCYNDQGFDQALTVTETTATFTGLDPQASYTIEVVAQGMSQCARAYVSANPITITDVQAEPFGEDSLVITWTYEGTAPAGGWLLLYTVDRGTDQHVIQCPEPSAVISPVVPGSHYDVTIQASGAVSVFGGTGSADVPQAQVFDYFDMDATAITMSLARVPGEDWSWESIDEEDHTTVFNTGEPMAILLATQQQIGQSDSDVTTMIVFRGSSGRVAQVFEITQTWNEMWKEGHCDLTVTQTPATPGEYTLQVYVDGKLLSNQNVIFE